MNPDEYKSKMQDLFIRWQANSRYKGKIIPDGVLCYEIWKNAEPRILFLLKETYEDAPSFTKPIPPINVQGKFWQNITLWNHLLKELYKKNQPPDFIEGFGLHQTIDDIAIINVKKVNEDRRTSVYTDIKKYAKNDNDLLKEEIDIIDPNIIVCGGTVDSFKIIFQGDCIQEMNFPFILKTGNRLIIRFYHPGARLKPLNLFNKFSELVKQIDYSQFQW